MSTLTRRHPNENLPLIKHLVAWFALLHALGVYALWHAYSAYNEKTVVLACVLFLLCHLSIRIGAHGYYSHYSFKMVKSLEVIILLLFSATLQASARVWTYMHLLHHKYSDTDQDPYSTVHGSWWAHFRWILHTPLVAPDGRPSSMCANPLVMWQEKYHHILGILVGLVMPTAIAALWGDALGGLLIAGFLRLTIQYHATWSINSLAHMYGGEKIDGMHIEGTTAKEAAYLLINVGEERHLGHHLFPRAYYHGTEWWHIDLGGYLIWVLSFPGWTYDLQPVPTKEERLRAIAAHNAKKASA